MNPVKIVLFDVDGVLIRIPHHFSKELENRGFENASTILTSFFESTQNGLCSESKADIREEILPFLKKINWKGTAQDYLRQHFQFESASYCPPQTF